MPPLWSINLLKGVVFRFQQYLGPTTMLLVKQSSKTGRFKHLSNNIVYSLLFWEYISCEGYLFLKKCWKFNLDLKNARNSPGKVFGFLESCIYIGCVKLSLLRREYLSSVVHVLTNSPNFLHITKRDCFWLNPHHSDQ